MGDAKDKTGIGNLDSPELPYDYGKREYGTVPLDHDNRAPFQWVSEVAYKNVHRMSSVVTTPPSSWKRDTGFRRFFS